MVFCYLGEKVISPAEVEGDFEQKEESQASLLNV